MTQNKYWIIGGVTLSVFAVLGLGIGGTLVYKKHFDAKASVASLPSEPAGNDAVANNTDSASAGGSSLAVGSGGQAASLGQLGGASGGSTQQGGSAAGGSGSGTSNSGSTPSPSTFGEYDKYKDGNAALFGDITKGSGAELATNQKAAVYYKGWLTNGQLFDQSRAGTDGKLQPFTFTLGAHEVIPGWEQGVVGMKVGGKRLIIVPPSVGYGAAGQGPIPGNAVLVFEVELLAVQ